MTGAIDLAIVTELSDRQVTVMGLGRFGGGAGVTRFLVERGARVLLTDQLSEGELAESLECVRDLVEGGKVRLRLGGHDEADFTGADLVVVNPAVNPSTDRYVRAAVGAGVAVTSEVRLLIEHLPTTRVLGVTGTAGKSTTAAMLHHVLVDQFGDERVWLGGNLGGSLLGDLSRMEADDLVVLELSSFMLDGLRHDRWSPRVAVVTNVHPNHLDWHGSFEHYVGSKQQILEHQGPTDYAILDASAARVLRPRTTRLAWLDDVGLQQLALPSLMVPGVHNLDNARMAVAAAARMGVDVRSACAALAGFGGLPHRLCTVAVMGGVRFIDDSKSTTPEAAMLAVDAVLGDSPGAGLHLILGGYDKQSDLSGLACRAAGVCRAVYGIGQTGPVILDHARKAGGGAELVEAGTVEVAVAAAKSRARAGDVVVLSPGCASWDQFANYEHRGRAFAQAVALRES